MRRFSAIVAVLVVFSGCAALKKAPGPSGEIERMIQATPELSGASVAISVRQLSGQEVYGCNSDKRMIPASNLKLITSGAALHRLGPDYRFKTLLGYTGVISDGTLDGDLYVIGGGDPTIGIDAFANWQTILQEAGVKRITGTVVGDGQAWEGQAVCPEWTVEDCTRYYGSGSNALCFEKNARDSLSVSNGDLICAEQFLLYLGENGIEVEGLPEGSDEPLSIIGNIASPSLKTIVSETLRESNNFYAEALFRGVAEELTGNASYDTSRVVIERILGNLGLDPAEAVIVDGSGLARCNSVSPGFMTAFLTAMTSSPCFDDFLEVIPHPGEGSKTLALKDTELAPRFRLKSGSMGGVLCYSGYYLDESGVPLAAVSVMFGGATAPKEALLPAMEQILSLLPRMKPE